MTPPSASPRSAAILVVDDEPAVTRFVARALEAYDVTVATSALEARSLCHGCSFDVILCDVTMSDFDGIDLWECLHEAGAGLEKRIAFMTGGTFTPRARNFLARVPNPCLNKPFPLAALEAVIESVLTSGRR